MIFYGVQNVGSKSGLISNARLWNCLPTADEESCREWYWMVPRGNVLCSAEKDSDNIGRVFLCHPKPTAENPLMHRRSHRNTVTCIGYLQPACVSPRRT